MRSLLTLAAGVVIGYYLHDKRDKPIVEIVDDFRILVLGK